MSDVLKKMGPQKGKKDTTKKPRKKFIGLAAKAKRRKQVSESRLAQRTGISAKDRRIKELIKKLTKNPEFYKKGIPKKKPDIDWEKLIPKLKPFELLKKVKPLSKKDIEKYLLKKGGKA